MNFQEIRNEVQEIACLSPVMGKFNITNDLSIMGSKFYEKSQVFDKVFNTMLMFSVVEHMGDTIDLSKWFLTSSNTRYLDFKASFIMAALDKFEFDREKARGTIIGDHVFYKGKRPSLSKDEINRFSLIAKYVCDEAMIEIINLGRDEKMTSIAILIPEKEFSNGALMRGFGNLPILFGKFLEFKFSEREKEMFSLIAKGDIEDFFQKVKEAMTITNRGSIVKKTLEAFFVRANDVQVDNALAIIKDKQEYILTLKERLFKALEEIETQQRLLRGLRSSDEILSEYSEFIDTLQEFKSVKVLNLARLKYDDFLRLEITEYLDSVDPDLFEEVKGNPYAEIYYSCDEMFDSAKMFYENIWGDKPTYRIKTSCLIDFFLNGELRSVGIGGESGMPQPHIAKYNCFGENEETFIELAETRNFASLVPAMVNAVKCLNLNDSTVCEAFAKQLWSYGNEYVEEISTGKMMSAFEVAQKLKKESENNE